MIRFVYKGFVWGFYVELVVCGCGVGVVLV